MDKKRGGQHPVENDEKLGVVTVTQNDETLPNDEADGPHARVTIDTNSFQNVGEFNFASTITTVVAGRLQDDGYEVPEELKNCAQNMVLTKEGRLGLFRHCFIYCIKVNRFMELFVFFVLFCCIFLVIKTLVYKYATCYAAKKNKEKNMNII